MNNVLILFLWWSMFPLPEKPTPYLTRDAAMSGVTLDQRTKLACLYLQHTANKSIDKPDK